jgi:hypothetical protein
METPISGIDVDFIIKWKIWKKYLHYFIALRKKIDFLLLYKR